MAPAVVGPVRIQTACSNASDSDEVLFPGEPPPGRACRLNRPFEESVHSVVGSNRLAFGIPVG